MGVEQAQMIFERLTIIVIVEFGPQRQPDCIEQDLVGDPVALDVADVLRVIAGIDQIEVPCLDIGRPEPEGQRVWHACGLRCRQVDRGGE